MKICSKCQTAKDTIEFHSQSCAKDGLQSQCKQCQYAYKKNRRDLDAPTRRNWYLQKTYGIDLEQYNKKFHLQNGRCAVCDIHCSELTRALHVDHNHFTGQVRGLLCHGCNTALGGFKENSDLLAKAIEYLAQYNDMRLQVVKKGE